MEAKSISEMTAEEINREIAERRGWVYDCYGWFDCTVNGRSILEGHDSPPDYREWQHAGPLLEEIARELVISYLDIPVPHRARLLCHPVEVHEWYEGAAPTLPQAIARAWLAWDRGKDDA